MRHAYNTQLFGEPFECHAQIDPEICMICITIIAIALCSSEAQLWLLLLLLLAPAGQEGGVALHDRSCRVPLLGGDAKQSGVQLSGGRDGRRRDRGV
jgi:hypothetical protein